MRQPRLKIFRLNQRRSWEKTIFALLSDKIGDDVLDEVRRLNPTREPGDHFQWLDKIVAHVRGVSIASIFELLASRLATHYDGIIAFHGCRPISLDSYKENGLLPSNISLIEAQARELFGDSMALSDAITDIGHSYRNHN